MDIIDLFSLQPSTSTGIGKPVSPAQGDTNRPIRQKKQKSTDEELGWSLIDGPPRHIEFD